MAFVSLVEKVLDAYHFLQNHWNNARIGVVLGSGLSELADQVKSPEVFAYDGIPHFPRSMVAGHRGQLILGNLEEKPVALLAGRFHYYEGYSLQEVTFPIRVLARLGIEILVLTNAAGGLHPEFRAGDLMIIKDHLNFIQDNPLRGVQNGELGSPFVSLTDAYDARLRKTALSCARRLGFRAREGVYLALSGPSYETPAEIKLYRSFGADALGMSTVPEVIVARQAELLVLGLSLITNVHKKNSFPTHDEVLEVARSSQKGLEELLRCLMRKI